MSVSGIRVEEAASCVGIGFSFNDGGGRITQVINDKGDDWANGLLSSSSINPTNFSCNDVNGSVFSAYYDPLNTDLKPDIFYFSFLGKSGKFFIDPNRRGTHAEFI